MMKLLRRYWTKLQYKSGWMEYKARCKFRDYVRTLSPEKQLLALKLRQELDSKPEPEKLSTLLASSRSLTEQQMIVLSKIEALKKEMERDRQ